MNVMYLISILTRKIDLREFFSILVKMSEKIGMQTKKFFVGFITWIYYRKQEIFVDCFTQYCSVPIFSHEKNEIATYLST